MDSFRAFQRLLTPIMARVRRVIMGAIIKMVNDGGDLQKMQVQSLGRSVYDNVEKFGVFGVSSNPPAGLDAIIVERGGKYICIAVGDRKYRIKNLESGDTVIYDIRGQTIVLNKSGINVTDCNGNNIQMSASGIKMVDANDNNITMSSAGINLNGVIIKKTGEMTTPDKITAGADVISGTGKTLDTHVHPFPYNAGPTPSNGTTLAPSA